MIGQRRERRKRLKKPSKKETKKQTKKGSKRKSKHDSTESESETGATEETEESEESEKSKSKKNPYNMDQSSVIKCLEKNPSGKVLLARKRERRRRTVSFHYEAPMIFFHNCRRRNRCSGPVEGHMLLSTQYSLAS